MTSYSFNGIEDRIWAMHEHYTIFKRIKHSVASQLYSLMVYGFSDNMMAIRIILHGGNRISGI